MWAERRHVRHFTMMYRKIRQMERRSILPCRENPGQRREGNPPQSSSQRNPVLYKSNGLS